MLNVTSINENHLQWVSIDDVSNVLNLSVKTVKEQCRIGKLNHKIFRIGKKSEYWISFNSLPEYTVSVASAICVRNDCIVIYF